MACAERERNTEAVKRFEEHVINSFSPVRVLPFLSVCPFCQEIEKYVTDVLRTAEVEKMEKRCD